MSTVVQTLAAARFAATIASSDRHFAASAERLVACAAAMADRFFAGGRLLIIGGGAATTDAQHNAVEFVHPVLPGCRALPAVSLGNDSAAVSTLLGGVDPEGVWAQQIETFGRRGDILLAFSDTPVPAAVSRALLTAGERGLLRVALVSGAFDAQSGADHQLAVATDDAHVAQEVHLATYHMLWELVHIVLNHRGIRDDSSSATADSAGHCVTCADTLTPVVIDSVNGATGKGRDGIDEVEVSLDLVDNVVAGDVLLCHAGVALQRQEPPLVAAGLYPMLSERPAAAHDLQRSLLAVPADKSRESNRLRSELLASQGARLEQCAVQIADRVRRGGTLFVAGNGGSAAAAADLSALCLAPPAGFAPMAALALTNDISTVTAVGNDIGYSEIFARQLLALAGTDDLLIAFSTSGSSENLVRAVEVAHRRGLLTVAIAGYDGGRVAREPGLDHSFVVSSDSVHRIQEVQATVSHTLWCLVQANLAEN